MGKLKQLLIGTDEGIILACNGRPEKPITCAKVVTGQRDVKGIVVNPIEGITIDFATQFLYWTDSYRNNIGPSDLRGHDYETIVQLSNRADPEKIALVGEKINESTEDSRKLKISRINRTHRRLHYMDNNVEIFQVVAVPSSNVPSGRVNHGGRQNCSKVCVLTASSFRCLE